MPTLRQSVMAALVPSKKIVLVQASTAHKFLNIPGTVKSVNTVDIVIERDGKNCYLSIPKAKEIISFDGKTLVILNPVLGGTLTYEIA
jgi:hypothetical protein